MNNIQIVLLLICLVGIAIEFFTLVFWSFNRKVYEAEELTDLPMVSVLIAVRNEEQNIDRCLKSLLIQVYPKSKMEIIIADDGSEDKTVKKVKKYTAENSFINLIKVKESSNHIKAKANALSQAADVAIGDYFLFTDADMEVCPTWIDEMVKHFDDNTGIINGITVVQAANGDRKFDQIQAMEWLNALGRVKIAHDARIPITGLGNNMAISKKAYLESGGYRAIKNSLVEDFEIFNLIQKKGFKYKSILQPLVLGITLPMNTRNELFQQRARWLAGVFRTNFLVRLALVHHLFYLPALMGTISISLSFALILFILKSGVQSLFLLSIYNNLKVKINWQLLITFDFLSWYINLRALLIYLFDKQTTWKGRKY